MTTLSFTTPEDHQREEEIEREYQDMIACEHLGNRREATYHMHKMFDLIHGRSPNQVAQLERHLSIRT